MAYYWNYASASTSSTTTAGWWANNSTAFNQVGTYQPTTAGSLFQEHYYVQYYVTRRILVETPEHWDEATTASFVRLLNDETKTGITVELVIKGEVAITDPSIEKRSMADFLPLLRSLAQPGDLVKIDAFFAAFGAPAEPDPPR